MWPDSPLETQRAVERLREYRNAAGASVFNVLNVTVRKIDPKVLHNHSEELTLRLAELEKKAHEIAGEEFNLSSTKQLQTILFVNRVLNR